MCESFLLYACFYKLSSFSISAIVLWRFMEVFTSRTKWVTRTTDCNVISFTGDKDAFILFLLCVYDGSL